MFFAKHESQDLLDGFQIDAPYVTEVRRLLQSLGRQRGNDKLEKQVYMVTSAARAADFEPPFLVPVTARESGLPRDGWIKCDQPATLPTSVLGPRVGRLSPAAIERLDTALRFVLGI